MATKPLPSTAYAVLGLLMADTPMSGYEIRKAGEQLKYFYWSPAQSQIYSELRRLEGLGNVTSIMVPQVGKPDKRMYQITEAGKNTFRMWLDTAPVDPTVTKHAMKLRLFFGEDADPSALEQHLTAFIAEGEQALAQLYIVREYRELDPDYLWSGLVAEWTEATLEAEVSYAKSLLDRLRAGEFN